MGNEASNPAVEATRRASFLSPPEARAYAVEAHGPQTYGDEPYAVHLDAVAAIAAPFGEVAEAVAYLHDVVEDTPVTLDAVRERFGAFVAECVSLLTDAPGATRKERKKITYERLAEVSGPAELALVVKVADRLANVTACQLVEKRSLLGMYRGEQPSFRAAAYRAGLCDELWERLESLLAVGLPGDHE